jgi:hypothetical protein
MHQISSGTSLYYGSTCLVVQIINCRGSVIECWPWNARSKASHLAVVWTDCSSQSVNGRTPTSGVNNLRTVHFSVPFARRFIPLLRPTPRRSGGPSVRNVQERRTQEHTHINKHIHKQKIGTIASLQDASKQVVPEGSSWVVDVKEL